MSKPLSKKPSMARICAILFETGKYCPFRASGIIPPDNRLDYESQVKYYLAFPKFRRAFAQAAKYACEEDKQRRIFEYTLKSNQALRELGFSLSDCKNPTKRKEFWESCRLLQNGAISNPLQQGKIKTKTVLILPKIEFRERNPEF